MTQPRSFEEVTILSSDVKKAWLKSTLNKIKHLINNQNFLMDKPKKEDPVRLFMDIYKVKILYDFSIDKSKLIIVVRGDFQNKEMVGDAWYTTALMRTLKYFLEDYAKHKARVPNCISLDPFYKPMSNIESL